MTDAREKAGALPLYLQRLSMDVAEMAAVLGVPGFPWMSDEQRAEAQAAVARANGLEGVVPLRPVRIVSWEGAEFRQVGPDVWDWRPVGEPVLPGADVTGAALIAAERRRQVMVEGFTEGHDRRNGGRGLVMAAQAYQFGQPERWPWRDGWKPKNRWRDLVRAGALYEAALELGSEEVDLEYAEARREECARLIDELLAEAREALRVEDDEVRRALERAYRALAYQYGGTTPGQHTGPEDVAGCDAMHVAARALGKMS